MKLPIQPLPTTMKTILLALGSATVILSLGNCTYVEPTPEPTATTTTTSRTTAEHPLIPGAAVTTEETTTYR